MIDDKKREAAEGVPASSTPLVFDVSKLPRPPNHPSTQPVGILSELTTWDRFRRDQARGMRLSTSTCGPLPSLVIPRCCSAIHKSDQHLPTRARRLLRCAVIRRARAGSSLSRRRGGAEHHRQRGMPRTDRHADPARLPRQGATPSRRSTTPWCARSHEARRAPNAFPASSRSSRFRARPIPDR